MLSYDSFFWSILFPPSLTSAHLGHDPINEGPYLLSIRLPFCCSFLLVISSKVANTAGNGQSTTLVKVPGYQPMMVFKNPTLQRNYKTWVSRGTWKSLRWEQWPPSESAPINFLPAPGGGYWATREEGSRHTCLQPGLHTTSLVGTLAHRFKIFIPRLS